MEDRDGIVKECATCQFEDTDMCDFCKEDAAVSGILYSCYEPCQEPLD